MDYLDNLLGKITMYRLMVYYLRVLVGATILLSFFGILPYNPWDILFSAAYLVTACYVFNKFFAKVVKTQTNLESYLITALILTLIVGPLPLVSNFLLLSFLAFVAMGSKYVLVINGRHIFNPAATAVLASALLLGEGASWWVSGKFLVPLVIIGGLLVLRKIHRRHLVASFLATYFVLFTALHFWDAYTLSALWPIYKALLINSPILFFAFVMLTEPLTAPQGRKSRIYYGAGIAIALVLLQRLAGIGYTLELALLLGNLGVRLFSRDLRLRLVLERQEQIATNIRNFWFTTTREITWVPGQFLEWTLPHRRPDSRGLRRYFTIASSPTERAVLLSTKFPPQKTSSYKQALLDLKSRNEAIVSHLEGEFVLPADQSRQLVFIAGGIGITPFRSMVKYLLDTNQSRQITLLYSARTLEELVFREIFDEAKARFGLKAIYLVSDALSLPPDFPGQIGAIDENLIKQKVSNWQTSYFYISGPEPMVRAFETMLSKIGVPRKQIKRDYFPGYAD